MPNGQMKESQAWRAIAERIERARRVQSGLCFEVPHDPCPVGLQGCLGCRMEKRAMAHVHEMPISERHGGYMATKGEVGPRILAAYFLSYEAADEGN